MKATSALLSGLAATTLLALGLARAAERFDPIMNPGNHASSDSSQAELADCSCLPCEDPDSPSNLA